LIEFDPTSTTRGKEILLLIHRSKQRGQTIHLMAVLRECGKNDERVTKGVTDDLLEPAMLDYTADEWGIWTHYEIGDDDWPDRFMFYTVPEV
jgi:hypothetical protein